MSWNPDQYLKFEAPRLRPAFDLLSRIQLDAPKQIYDLGCGTGNITHVLADRWPDAHVTGIDDSAQMLAKAAETTRRIEWICESVADWQPATPPDLIFSNAALHWLFDHATLFRRLVSMLQAGGVLAVQMPRNFLAPSHTLMHEVARDPRWRSKLEPLIQPPPVHDPSFYYAALEGAGSIDIWETEYLQVLSGKDPVKEWTKGTWLRRFLDALDSTEQREFESMYARRVAEAYPPTASGVTLFPFRRIFILVRKR